MSIYRDTRRMSSAAQEELRYRVVQAVIDQGMLKAQAARTFRVSRTSVHEWVKKQLESAAYVDDPRGQEQPSIRRGVFCILR